MIATALVAVILSVVAASIFLLRRSEITVIKDRGNEMDEHPLPESTGASCGTATDEKE